MTATKMIDAGAIDFPFVEALPKREKSRLQTVWEHFQELRAITAQKGMLVPLPFVAKLLDVSHPRVCQLIEAGRLEAVEVNGHRLVTESSVIELAKADRKAGRPVKLPETVREQWAVAKSYASRK